MTDTTTDIIEAQEQAIPQGPNSLVQMAMNNDFDLARLQQVIDMQERQEARAAERAFTESLNKAQSEMPKVLFDKKNTGTDSMYATLAQVNATVNPIINKNGFTVSYNEEGFIHGEKEFVTFSAELRHIGGFVKTFSKTLPLDDINRAKNKLQAMGSTISLGACSSGFTNFQIRSRF